jgi:SWI/SNF-related matrix-associated actin-dependent regulator of chromatin subfamily A3
MFNRDIINHWKNGDSQLAVSRLKRLLSYILLRRSQGTVKLPKRTDLKYTLQLRSDEREHYDAVQTRVIQSVDAALQGARATGTSFASVIQHINELRLVCNLGHHRKPPSRKAPHRNKTWTSLTAQKAMTAMAATEFIACNTCGLVLDATSMYNLLGADLYSNTPRCWLFSCLKIACETCMLRSAIIRCDCTTPCPSATVTYTLGTTQSTISSPSSSSEAEDEPFPTKIQALVDDLLKQSSNTKRYVATISIARLIPPQEPKLIDAIALFSPFGPRPSISSQKLCHKPRLPTPDTTAELRLPTVL